MFCIENLSATRGKETLFSGFGTTLGVGSLLIVKGPNGCGKTTLLQILAGLRKAEKGSILWEDKDIKNNIDFQTERQFIGHKNALFPELTVEENLYFWAKMLGNLALIPAALKHFGLEDKVKLPCYRLSQGWQRRVAISKLLLSPASVWFLDEPFANLDEDASDKLQKLIAARCDRGGIVILSTHQAQDIPFGSHIWLPDFTPKKGGQ